MEEYFGIGFIILCVGIFVFLTVAIAAIFSYTVRMTKEKLEVAPSKDNSKSNQPKWVKPFTQ